MRIIGFVASLVMLGVGVWAHLRFGTMVHELRENHGLSDSYAYGSFDDVFYHDDSGGQPDLSTHQPRSALSSGLQTNPYIE